MRIAIIITGGTILSEEKSGFFTLSDSQKKEILSLIPNTVEAEVFSPYFILSEQLDGAYLTALIENVGDRLNDGYDGIVILHGTDTLQYSAAALSLAFGDAAIPVVLVSANYVLSDERSNGRENLLHAIKFIEQKIGGVFVSYKNNGAKPEIFRGDTLLPHLPYSDTLFSLNNERKYNPIGKFSLSRECPVLWLRIAPGMVFPDTEGYKAVLLDAYHSGTLPTESESFVSFCEGCTIPVYVTGVTSGTQYESAKPFDRLGLNILPETSPVFAYISLWQRYGS